MFVRSHLGAGPWHARFCIHYFSHVRLQASCLQDAHCQLDALHRSSSVHDRCICGSWPGNLCCRPLCASTGTPPGLLDTASKRLLSWVAGCPTWCTACGATIKRAISAMFSLLRLLSRTSACWHWPFHSCCSAMASWRTPRPASSGRCISALGPSNIWRMCIGSAILGKCGAGQLPHGYLR